MALPKMDLPIYEIKLPSTQEKLRIRPWTVKDNKILLLALESNDLDQMILATKQVINNCVLKDNFDVDALPTFDIEYLIVQLRAKSVSEELELKFQGLEDTDCKKCQLPKKMKVDLTKVNVEFSEGASLNVKIRNDIGVVMKYPTYGLAGKLQKMTQDGNMSPQIVFDVVCACIDSIYDGDNITSAKDCTPQQLMEFLESLSMTEFQKIQSVFDNMPRLRHVIETECPSCGTNQYHVMEGLHHFLV